MCILLRRWRAKETELLKCRDCGFQDTKVLESRESRDGSTVRRRRECLQCGARMTTFERFEESPVYVVKRNGYREIFSKEKLLKSLDLAFRKRSFNPDIIEKIATKVETMVRETGEREILTSRVGEIVLEILRDVDPVAYVRFASVYRAFSNAEDFVCELKSIEAAISSRPVSREPSGDHSDHAAQSVEGSV